MISQFRKLTSILITLTILLTFVFSINGEIKLKPQGFLSDFTNLLSENTRNKIEKILNELEKKTSIEFAVVIVKNLDGYPIENYSIKLFEQWGIGKKNKNNGVLFITSLEDRKVRIEVGYGLEGIITDGTAWEILDKYVLPYYKKGDYDSGILYGTLAVINRIEKEYNITLTSPDDKLPENFNANQESSSIESFLVFLFIMLIFFAFLKYPFLFLGRTGGNIYRSSGRGGFGSFNGFGGFGGGISGGGGASRSW